MKIAIVKPDYHIQGGFETVLERLSRSLVEAGHVIDWLTVDATSLRDSAFGVTVPSDVWHSSPEFFRYLAMVEAFRAMDTSEFDLVISGQPPSFAVDHPRHLTIFYHHHRIFYDLADLYIDAGFSESGIHRHAQKAIHEIDARILGQVRHFLVPSDTVRRRLQDFNGITSRLSTFHAGPGLPEELLSEGSLFDHVLCVSRHEFPKRTELFVRAMSTRPDLSGMMVGTGGRLQWVRSLGAATTDITDEETWLQAAPVVAAGAPGTTSNVRFVTDATNEEVAGLYRSALCVVAPAHQEDYGLTAIEAAACGKPIIVCKDGGGLVELVEDGVTGLVVEPSTSAIAAAIGRLAADVDLARALGANAYRLSRQFTWTGALEELFEGIVGVMR